MNFFFVNNKFCSSACSYLLNANVLFFDSYQEDNAEFIVIASIKEEERKVFSFCIGSHVPAHKKSKYLPENILNKQNKHLLYKLMIYHLSFEKSLLIAKDVVGFFGGFLSSCIFKENHNIDIILCCNFLELKEKIMTTHELALKELIPLSATKSIISLLSVVSSYDDMIANVKSKNSTERKQMLLEQKSKSEQIKRNIITNIETLKEKKFDELFN